MALFLGLDCGGSSCRAMAVDEDGGVVFQGHAGPANILSTPFDLLRKSLCQATAGCPEPTTVCGCFAGLVNLEETNRAETILREVFPTARIQALPDYCAAFMASPPGTHACVIAGTGSIVCSRTGSDWVKTGGRGYLLGNPGSAFRYGQASMMQYLEHPSDATEADRTLIEKIFGSPEETQIIAQLYRSPSPAALLARIAPVLGRDAQAGKPYALAVLEEQTAALADQVEAHIEKHFSEEPEPRVSAAGGVWSLNPIFLEAFKSRFARSQRERSSRTVVVSKVQRPPVHGAAQLALEMS